MKILPNQLQLVDENKNVIETIDPKKVYQCSVIHNVVPYSLNPSDKSWCGIAFPYGDRSNSSLLNVK